LRAADLLGADWRGAAALVAGAVAGVLIGVEAAQAQAGPAIPAHRIDRTATGSACAVSILPDMRTSDDSPVLVARSGGAAAPGAFALDAVSQAPVAEIQFVARNARNTFAPVRQSDAAAVARSALWKDLVAVHKAGAPFHLTARLADGTWTSSRYDAVDPLGIVRLLEQSCGFRSDTLSARTAADLLAEESALRLSPDELTHIRWILVQKYDPRAAEPTRISALSATERVYLERYAGSVGQPATRHLTRALADRLRAEMFRPSPHDYSRMLRVSFHGDWVNYITPGDNRCHMETAALAWTSGRFFKVPRMNFNAEANTPGSAMRLNMVMPNPFTGSAPVTALVDGRSYRLQVDSDRVWPLREGEGLSNAVTKAIKGGQSVQISGTDRASSAALSLSFSAIGFTASFNQMSADCRRPQLRDWLQ